MTLVKFKKHRLPWYDTMFSDLIGTDRLFSDEFFSERKWVPAMNIKENDDNFEIEVAAPSFSKKDFEITIENGVLHISAEKKEEKEEKEGDYTRKEFSYNTFSRSITLPENVDEEENIEATYEEGILKLTLAKIDKEELSQKRVIEIS
ncbi:MAG: Hsp20/alpha crystallin family protein [Bacteroidota bacterium]